MKKKLGSEAGDTGTLEGTLRSPGLNSDTETLKELGKPGDPSTGLGLADAGPRPLDAGAESTKDHEEPPKKRRRGAVFYLLIALIALVILGIALGVGLGVGLTRHHSSQSSSYVYERCFPSHRRSQLTIIAPHLRLFRHHQATRRPFPMDYKMILQWQ